MHTQGTAVLDRPTEVAPAKALSPVSDSGASAHDRPPAKSITHAMELPAGHDVHVLTYTELAVALNASGVHPKQLRSELEPARLMEWAAQGLALLGIDLVRHFARRTCALNLLPWKCVSAEGRAEYRLIWPRHEAFQPCHDAAHRIIRTRTIP